jgi:hypothetical protein
MVDGGATIVSSPHAQAAEDATYDWRYKSQTLALLWVHGCADSHCSSGTEMRVGNWSVTLKSDHRRVYTSIMCVGKHACRRGTETALTDVPVVLLNETLVLSNDGV